MTPSWPHGTTVEPSEKMPAGAGVLGEGPEDGHLRAQAVYHPAEVFRDVTGPVGADGIRALS